MIRIEIEIRVSEKQNKRSETIVLETDYPACVDLLPEVKRLKIKLVSQVIAERERQSGPPPEEEGEGEVGLHYEGVPITLCEENEKPAHPFPTSAQFENFASQMLGSVESEALIRRYFSDAEIAALRAALARQEE